MDVRRFLLGLVFLATAAAIFWLATYGFFAESPPDGESRSHLEVYTNHPEIPAEVNLNIDSEPESSNVWITFFAAPLPEDFRWALLGSENLAFTAVDDGQTGALVGQVEQGAYFPSECRDASDEALGMNVLAESILIGNATEAWIPGIEGSKALSSDTQLKRSQFSFGLRLPLDEIRHDEVDAYAYDIGWFGQFAASSSGDPIGRYPEKCIILPEHGQVETSPLEAFKVTVMADATRDRVVFSQPQAVGEGRVSWDNPVGIVRVTFDSPGRRALNSALLFVSGILVGLGTGVWSGILLGAGRRVG